MKPDDRLCDALAAQLDQLADGCRNAEDVAAKLAKAGIKGKRSDDCGCPVSVWLARQIQPPPDWIVGAGIDIAVVLAPGPLEMTEVAVAPVPDVIASFIVAFDDEYEFPELEAVAPAPVS